MTTSLHGLKTGNSTWLQSAFYLDDDVVGVAHRLIGKVLVTRIDGLATAGIIVETEAYAGVTDRASHAYGGRRTSRTEIMFRTGGCAYVYLCYGIHSLFNVVTGPEGTPHAVLIRGVLPLSGLPVIASRFGVKDLIYRHTNGPGKVCRALGINYRMSGESLFGNLITIEDWGITVPDELIVTTTRIGVDYAGDDALLPYRFVADESLINHLMT